MRFGPTWREVTALGPRRAAAFGWFRLRRGLRQALGLDHRGVHPPLTDAEWTAGLAAGGEDAAVRNFLSGAADLGWAAAQAPDHTRRVLMERFPDHVRQVIALADATCDGTVLICSRQVDAGWPADWQRDWFGTFRWPADAPSHTIAIGQQPGADPRIAWELGRCHHVLTLAQGWFLSGRPELADAALRWVRDFRESNPPGFGIQWTSTMDVAIRAANWLAAWQFLRRYDGARAEAAAMLRALVEHGRFIMDHLETRDGITSNHYLADLAGLAYLGHLEFAWPGASAWHRHWREALPREVERQVLEDGTGFEASICYHRLSFELLAFPLVDARLRHALPAGTVARIARMATVSGGLLSRQGLVPQFGDNDGGHLHRLQPRPSLDHAYVPSLGRAADPGLPAPDVPEACWLFEAGPPPVAVAAPALFLPDGGLGVLRDGAVELFFTCGPNGQGERGGHAHNDKLSIVLMVDGEPVIVDPGTYTYTRDPDLRRAFRATAWHSTLEVGAMEQNRFSHISLFRLIPDARPEEFALRTRPGRMDLSGAHTGYERAPLHLRHQRRVSLRPGGRCIVLDRLAPTRSDRAGAHELVLSLPLAPGLDGDVRADGWTVETGRYRLTGVTRGRGVSGAWSRETGWVSQEYGERDPATVIRFRGRTRPSHRCPVLRTEIHVEPR